MIRIVVAWGPATLWAAVLFYLSSLRFDDAPPPVEINDKVVHFVLYGVLGALLAWGRARAVSPSHGLVLGAGFLYALSDEFHQRFVPGRTPSGWDLLADALGLVVGYATLTHLMSARRA